MLTPLQVKTMLADNLNADIQLSAQIYLSNLITRTDVNSTLPPLRIMINTGLNSGNYVTDLADLILNLDESLMTIESGSGVTSQDVNNNAVKPIIITPTNLDIEIYTNMEADVKYTSFLNQYSNTKSTYKYVGPVELINKRLMFTLGYLNDGDLVLPLKLINIKLF